MRLPYLSVINNKTRRSVINFLGINYGNQITDGEFEDCLNLSADEFPYMTQRNKRTASTQYSNPTTVFSRSGLFVVDGTNVLYNGENIGAVTEGKKQMAAIGNYVVIFPDKKYFNTETEVFGDMEDTYTSGAGQIEFKSSVAGEDDDGNYSTITTTGADFNFRVGDAVDISGCTVNPENNQSIIIRKISGKVLKFYANSFTDGVETGVITIKRSIPDLEFVCESNYRLWGCEGNTIYGSKYGDPLNFKAFDGLSSDSYNIQVGTDGDFTGCIPFSNYLCFFKEDVLHKLYGSKPSNFQLLTNNIFGVQAGSEKSMCMINETLYYLGKDGIYAFTGGIPELISGNFGTRKLTKGCAGSDGNKYYISMQYGSEKALFTFDVLRNIWLKEDNTDAVGFANIGGDLCYIDNADKKLYKANSGEGDEAISWSATFCTFTETINEKKGYSRLALRLELDKNSWLTVEVKLDDKAWKTVHTIHSEKLKTVTLPIHPNRCDNFKVRLSGKGKCRIKAFSREFIVGSEV